MDGRAPGPWLEIHQVAGDQAAVTPRAPGQAQHERRTDELRRPAGEIRAVTAVRIVLRARHEAGPHAILVDVPHEGDEVLVRLAEERLVPALKHMAHLGVPPVEALCVGLLEALHEPVEGRRGRAEYEVHVIGH